MSHPSPERSPHDPSPRDPSLHARERRARAIAGLALTVALVGLVAWWMVALLDAPFLPVALVSAVATMALLIRVARLEAEASRRRRGPTP